MSLVSTRRDVGEQKPPDAVPCLSRDKKRPASPAFPPLQSRRATGTAYRPVEHEIEQAGGFDDGFASVPLDQEIGRAVDVQVGRSRDRASLGSVAR
jgi:hypothetical protein